MAANCSLKKPHPESSIKHFGTTSPLTALENNIKVNIKPISVQICAKQKNAYNKPQQIKS